MTKTSVSIRLEGAGKKFLKNWLFRNLSLELKSGERIAITGLNGSGKSTLLQILSGYVSLSEGSITLRTSENSVEQGQWYHYLAVATPYLDLPEELTLRENIDFYSAHKALRLKNAEAVAELSGLQKVMDRPLKFFSSGMKQRVRLVLALTADVPIVLLDEPVSNLDREGVSWFHQLCAQLPAETLLVICSNHVADEINLCTRSLELSPALM